MAYGMDVLRTFEKCAEGNGEVIARECVDRPGAEGIDGPPLPMAERSEWKSE